MLYKVTPMLGPPQKPKEKPLASQSADVSTQETKQPRKRRKSSVYDAEGQPVLITMMCLKCRSMKPLAMFGLRKMADGVIRNQPWCRTCRSGASTKKKAEQVIDAPPTTASLGEPDQGEALETATSSPAGA